MTLRASCFILAIAGLVSLIFPLQALGVPPDPNVLLLAVRRQQAYQQGVLHARLRERSHATPFRIVWEAGTIRYEFSHPDQTLLLKLGEKSAELWEQKGAKTSPITVGRFNQPVRGTSVTYEDLAWRFLYWPNPIIVGEDNLHRRPAWVLQVQSPGRSSRYGGVRIWIDKEAGVLLRMEGFDSQGRFLKRFEVVSAQKVKGRWFLKEMRIEECDPATKKITSRAYLDVSVK